MTSSALIKALRPAPLVPVIKLNSPEDVRPIARGLLEGGLPVAEITFRSDAAAEGISTLRRDYPEMLTGAGTVLTTDQADAAIEAGAQFIVAPGLNPRVVRHVLDRGVLMIPGVCTPGEMEAAMEFGLELVKFFPAEAAGGVPFLKAVLPVYPDLSFMPTGGITPDNVRDYLSLPSVVACGGSWMVKSIEEKEIMIKTRQALDLIRGISHV
jgi:2-dehydro-3-deoxyphosphogluconate aldolase / (4S)-4-hydroxy-2-oxoglutarate aldolase